MPNFTVLFSKTFDQELDKLSQIDQERVMKKVSFLEVNPFHPSLRSKKLQGKPDHFECSVSMSIRIIWRYEGDKIIVLIDVGHHDILKKY